MSYMIVACNGGEETKESTQTILKSRIERHVDEIARFDVPESLKFGSFDSLIKLTDDLQKTDSQIEGSLRRIERQILDLDPRAEFKIISQRKQSSLEAYIRTFSWDDHKFPRTRALTDNLQLLLSSVQKLDEEVKNKAFTFGEVKQQWGNIQKSKQAGGATLVNVDLNDILTPEVVNREDFVETEHLTTQLLVIGKADEKRFLSSYEQLCSLVVPQSAKNFPASDKEGNILYRVVLFKKELENFLKEARANKFTVRDFKYSEEAYRMAVDRNQTLKAEFAKQETFLRKVCHAAFSDTLVAWLHLKAMRVFVEAVLRYGVPPNFAAFILKPSKGEKNKARLLKDINDVFSASGLFGQSYLGNAGDKQPEGGDGEEPYYSYVNLSLSPLSTSV